jgi:murein L,D-transpeptidase YcbB/YkuD
MTGFRIPLAAGLTLSLAAAAASGVQAAEPDGPEQIISRTDAVYITVLDRLGARGKKSLDLDKGDEKGLTDYYTDRGNALVWVDDDGLNGRVKQLRTVFARAGEWGLNPAAYTPADGKGFSKHGGYPAAWLAEAELKTSIAAVTYARQAQTGQLEPTAVNADLDKHPEHPDPAAVLKGVLGAGDGVAAYLETFNPPHEQFKALKRLLANGGENAAPAEADTKGAILPDGPSLGPGTSHPHIAILHERLSVQPLRRAPDGGSAEEYYDDRLANAVRGFQKRHGLAARGIVNAATREALNAEASSSAKARSRKASGSRIDRATILANMERWRWENRDLGTRHIRVNIPEFMFYVVDNGRVIHTERIVAGSKEHPTPIFSDEMETIVFKPYWHVPVSILTKEILPAIRRDPSFLDRNRLEVEWQGRKPVVVDSFWGGFGEIDWDYVDASKISLRQTPGAGNALGVVKFAFPNKHSVYMHDTPTKHLFDKEVRAYSHGCMRVRNPLKFAEVLLSKQGWTAGRINATLETAHDEHVNLQHKVPIHIQYFTLWVGDDGRVRRYGDIYGHDARVKAALKVERNAKVDDDSGRLDDNEHGLGN